MFIHINYRSSYFNKYRIYMRKFSTSIGVNYACVLLILFSCRSLFGPSVSNQQYDLYVDLFQLPSFSNCDVALTNIYKILVMWNLREFKTMIKQCLWTPLVINAHLTFTRQSTDRSLDIKKHKLCDIWWPNILPHCGQVTSEDKDFIIFGPGNGWLPAGTKP